MRRRAALNRLGSSRVAEICPTPPGSASQEKARGRAINEPRRFARWGAFEMKQSLRATARLLLPPAFVRPGVLRGLAAPGRQADRQAD